MKRTWTREETMIAFNLYCKLPFKESTRDSVLIERYAEILKRSPEALILKIGDLARLDPDLRRFSNKTDVFGVKCDRDVWDDFTNSPMQLVFNSEKMIARITGREVRDVAEIDDDDLPKGCHRKDPLRRKVGFGFFRKVVLSSYNSTCCISGLKNGLLVEACHIAEWGDDENMIVNPRNGLCLNFLMHKAYDRKLVSVSPDYKISVAEEMIMGTIREDLRTYLSSLNGRQIFLPDRFRPSRDLLAVHYDEFRRLRTGSTF